jgi:propanediol dehydratase-reactivating factor small subunit
MADYAPMSELRKPAIVVLLVRGRAIDIQPVLWGMEEEGIPFEIQECSSGEVIGVAKEAAHISPLNVGIGVDGAQGTIVLHHRDLPADQPLFVLSFREAGTRTLQRLGINAARLVKSEPLVLADEPEITGTPRRVPATTHSDSSVEDVSDELVEQIVRRILAEMVKA